MEDEGGGRDTSEEAAAVVQVNDADGWTAGGQGEQGAVGC